jgi:hypothetical protein
MNSYFFIKKLSLSEERAFGLDSSSVKIENSPWYYARQNIGLTRLSNQSDLKFKNTALRAVFFIKNIKPTFII